MITVIGRGHSGTRAISQTLSASGVYMGEPLNASGDLIPPHDMYAACRVLGGHVRWKGGLEWDFGALHDMQIPEAFAGRIRSYLQTVLARENGPRGWKIPETTLAYPWIRRLFPEVKYIFWVRDPRDCVIGGHVTDDLRDFGIAYPETDDIRRRRAISWKYQYDLVQSTPRPRQWLEIRFEDFVLRQAETLARLESYLGMALVRTPVRHESVGRWRSDTGAHNFEFFAPALAQLGYPEME